MPVGKSGRIVIEIDPILKQELYQSLGKEDSSLKEWFLSNVQGYLSGKTQMPIDFESDDLFEKREVS
jgi:hypothetical protein|tara:strand:- start:380 stop:580 length:201 start_codon:yes stop_codon:yes gene_type:complete